MRRYHLLLLLALALLVALALVAGRELIHHPVVSQDLSGASRQAAHPPGREHVITSRFAYGLIFAAVGLFGLWFITVHRQLLAKHRRKAHSAELLRKIAVTANEASDVNLAMEACLDEVCAYTGWPIGHAYELAGDGTGDLAPTEHWHLDDPERYRVFREVTMATRFAPGVGLPGRVLLSGEPAWIVDVNNDSNFPRARMADDIGIKAGMGFPILVGREVAAVLEFFSEKAANPDQDALDIMAQVGTQLGRVIERQRAETSLRKSKRALQNRVRELVETRRRLEQQGSDLIRLTADLEIARDSAEAANRAKTDFLAAMSHELRTPLNAVLGFSEVIKDETLGPVGSIEYREYATDIHDSGQHLLDLINDILDISKIESGTDVLCEEEIEVPEIVASVRRLLQPRSKAGGVELELDIPDDLPLLRADPRKLKQILVNLLTNAVKFSHPGGRVRLSAWRRKDSNFVFQIVDSGIGIAPEDMPKALSHFGQIDSGLNRRYEGTGLGLPLTKALVEQHGGSLELESVLELGTTVTVRFPATRALPLPDASASGSQGKAAG